MGNTVLANLILLGFAVRHGYLFCTPESVGAAIRDLSGKEFVDTSLVAFGKGYEY